MPGDMAQSALGLPLFELLLLFGAQLWAMLLPFLADSVAVYEMHSGAVTPPQLRCTLSSTPDVSTTGST